MPMRSLARNAAAMAAQVVLSALALLVTYWLLMRALRMEEIGLWSLIVGTATVARLGEMGLGGGVLRFVAADTASGLGRRAARTVGMAAAMVTVLAGSLALAAKPVLATYLVRLVPAELDQAALSLLVPTLVSVVLSALANVFLSAIDGCQRMDLRARLMVASSLVQLGAVWFVLPRWGLAGLGLAQLVQSGFLLTGSAICATRLLGQAPGAYFGYDGERLRELVRYGGALQLSALGQLAYEPTLKVMLAAYSGLALAGYVDIATRVLLQFRSVLVSASNAIIPHVAAQAGHGTADPARVRNTYRQSFGLLIYVLLPFFGCVAASLPLALILWKGHYDATLLAVTLLQFPAIWLGTAMSPAYQIFLGIGRIGWIIASHALNTLTLVVLGVVLGSVFAGAGILVAGALAIGLSSLAVIYGFHRTFGVQLGDLLSYRQLPGAALTFGVLAVGATIASNPGIPSQAVLWGLPAVVGLASAVLAWYDPMRTQLLARLTPGARAPR